jgi:hypothetical protein
MLPPRASAAVSAHVTKLKLDERFVVVTPDASVRPAGGGRRCLAGRSIVRERPAVLEPVPPLQRIDRSLLGLPDGGGLLCQSIL